MPTDHRGRLTERRAALEERLRALRATRGEIIAASASSNADDEHDPEGSTIAYDRAQVGALIASAEHEREELDAALARIEDGTHGVCERCGRPIPAARLEVRPAARTCVGCG
ncbi:transcriptional regulator, TraR/DksA family [Beutenbergia cavernae DSM 12333]|uniref:Transcriptional regulator, TraR/DksA family n=1 Tax=Beutenbergia cavernae (strain ATCC BAA-8 / DSM 12333 / CCUG 43141 / JCM 11478 / NBRC 16432 / NCIMB 13614 / HKI 0122) TaxID=471853 RepID=C5C3L5_BEUC1|nr:TraR/DksA C4-type zinc finger protein [Beutenbergia cavernae]ACQ81924.1 transcriptional regulator, TraR/DksA family [Beutenbergia cavernae DSM 12333]